MRGLVIFTATVLALDALLLGLAAWWTRSGRLALVALGAGIGAVAVVVSWRWHRRRLRDLSAAGHELANDLRDFAATTRRPSGE